MSKYIMHRRSKYQFPTQVVRTGAGKGGQLSVGHVRALEDITSAMKRKMGKWISRHTKGQWVFAELKK